MLHEDCDCKDSVEGGREKKKGNNLVVSLKGLGTKMN
jgi:hypothetical protein